ncbi:MAG: magnesium/cobalt transporter CorA [Gemmataceae bacterium]
MIQIHRFGNVTHQCEHLAVDQLPASVSDLADDDVIWIDLHEPTAEEEQRVFEQFFKIHTLTLEDITKPRREKEQGAHLPKVEEFPNYLFVIVNPLPKELTDAQTKPVTEIPAQHRTIVSWVRSLRRTRPQLSAILSRNVLITHHYQPLACTAEIDAYVHRHGDCVGRGPDYVFHLILDAMVDEYAPVVERVADRLDRLESRIFRDPSPKILYRILRLKRLVTSLRKTLILEREVLARLTRGEFSLVEERERVYYRNVFDHLVRYTELIESAREMVTDLMEAHLSATSNRLNAIMKVLAMISTIILPMTLIAGIYGMNFETGFWPDLKNPWGFPISIALMGLTGLIAYLWFRWKKWA